MIPSQIAYQKPESLEEALNCVGDLGDMCKILAGGHSLIPVMKLRLADPENLVDITGIPGLKEISDAGDSISIGACATHADIANSRPIHSAAPMVSKAASMIGDIQVRNFGTIGGSIAHADPSADWPAVLLAADASINMQSRSGSRSVKASEFFLGLFMTALQTGEIITSIDIPKSAANANSNYEKFAQPASRFALVGCAVAADNSGDALADVRVAFNGVSATPFRDGGVESALTGSGLNDESISAACGVAADGVDVMSDHFASSAYRKSMAAVFAKRALKGLS